MSEDRSPYDGKPFYCKACGAGFGEYIACEMPDCLLESVADAGERRHPFGGCNKCQRVDGRWQFCRKHQPRPAQETERGR
jgi:hypothetical protein